MLKERAVNFIRKNLFLAFSGGVDSAALLEILYIQREVIEKFIGEYNLYVLYFNHGTDFGITSSKINELKIKSLSEDFFKNNYFTNTEFPIIEGNEESSWRKSRYEWLYKTIKEVSLKENLNPKDNYLLTGHHLTDNLVSNLKQYCAGGRGYIYPVRNTHDDYSHKVLRPLFLTAKEDLYTYMNGYKYKRKSKEKEENESESKKEYKKEYKTDYKKENKNNKRSTLGFFPNVSGDLTSICSPKTNPISFTSSYTPAYTSSSYVETISSNNSTLTIESINNCHSFLPSYSYTNNPNPHFPSYSYLESTNSLGDNIQQSYNQESYIQETYNQETYIPINLYLEDPTNKESERGKYYSLLKMLMESEERFKNVSWKNYATWLIKHNFLPSSFSLKRYKNKKVLFWKQDLPNQIGISLQYLFKNIEASLEK